MWSGKLRRAGGQTGFRIQDSGEGMKSICFPPSADRLAMQDSSRAGSVHQLSPRAENCLTRSTSEAHHLALSVLFATLPLGLPLSSAREVLRRRKNQNAAEVAAEMGAEMLLVSGE